ncbi:MAG: carboxypeptidase-like regulatory domain-containing protein, partial [Halobacteriales archaeon]
MKLLAVALAGLMITQVLIFVPGSALGVTKSGGNTSVSNLAGNAPTAHLPDATINDSTSSDIEVAYNGTGKVTSGDLRISLLKPNGSVIAITDPSNVKGTDTLTVPAGTFGGGDIRVSVDMLNTSTQPNSFVKIDADKAVISTESPVKIENYTLSSKSVSSGENLTVTVTLNNTDQSSAHDYSLVLWDNANPSFIQFKSHNKSKRVTVPAGATKQVKFNRSWSNTTSFGSSNIGIQWVTINEEASKPVTVNNGSTGFINGTVRNQNGTPVSGVSLEMINKNTNLIHANVSTDANGEFSIEVKTGKYDVLLSDPKVSFRVKPGVKVTAGNTTYANFSVSQKPPSGTLNGTVLGPNGNPVTNARIEAADQSFQFFGTTKTDTNGNFSLSLPAAQYEVRVSNTPYATKTIEDVNVSANKSTFVNISLPKATYINGTVSKAGGQLKNRAFVMASSGDNRVFNVTSKTGAYNLSVPNGTYTVTVFSKVGTASASIATDPENVTRKDFTLRPVKFNHTSVEVVDGASSVDTNKIGLRTRVFSGLINVQVVNDNTYGRQAGRPDELEGLGVNDTTEFRINLTVTNFTATSLMWGINNARWNATPNSSVKNGTDITINGSAVQLQATFNGTAGIGPLFDRSPSSINWPTGKKDRASVGFNQTVYLGILDQSSLPPEVRSALKGMSITTNAQMFAAPRVVNNSLKIWVAGPSTTVDGLQHTGFYQAEIPEAQLNKWNVSQPEKELAALYKGSATNFTVTNTSDGARIRLENITYSAGTVEVSPDTIAPTADAGSDMTVKKGNSVTFNASQSTDNQDIEF